MGVESGDRLSTAFVPGASLLSQKRPCSLASGHHKVDILFEVVVLRDHVVAAIADLAVSTALLEGEI